MHSGVCLSLPGMLLYSCFARYDMTPFAKVEQYPLELLLAAVHMAAAYNCVTPSLSALSPSSLLQGQAHGQEDQERSGQAVFLGIPESVSKS